MITSNSWIRARATVIRTRPPTIVQTRLSLICRTRPLRTARSMPRRARQTVTPMARRYGLTDAFDREASPVSQSLQFADVNAGDGRSDLHHATSQAASDGPGGAPATTPNNHADGRSQSPAAHDMPSDHAASPAWQLFQSGDANAGNGPPDPQHVALPGQAMLHVPAGTSAAGPNNHADGPSHGSSALSPVGDMTSARDV